MQGPVFDILLLLLLILFFGLHQRTRPQLYFRFWFLGWLLVLGSYIVWEFSPAAGISTPIENSTRYDMLVLAGISFSMGFLATAGHLKKSFAKAALVAVPACAAIDLQMLQPLPAWAMRPAVAILVLVGHGFALKAIRRDLPRSLARQRTLILIVFAGLGVAMTLRAAFQPQEEVMTWIMTEIMLFAALLYARSQNRLTVAGVVGTVGFTAWALFYHMAEILAAHPAALANFYHLWNLPKYSVGFSMIMRIFEESDAEKDRLAQQFHSLYDDFRILYHNHPHPMWVLTAESSQLVAANEIAASTYGYTDANARTLRLEDIEVPLDEETAPLAGLVPQPPGSRRCRLRCKNGDILWVNIYDRPITFRGAPARLIMARDVTDFMQFNSAMAHTMGHDDLTGLPNRRLLTDRLQLAIASTLRQGSRLAVMIIDIDHFKRINDTYGHAVGDECLKLAASRLRSCIRQSDTIARFGGEEFIALISSLHTVDDAMKVARELLHVFDAPLELSGLSLPVTVSIGVALCPDHGLDTESLHRLADEALYRAKHDGRNCIRFTEPASELAAILTPAATSPD